VRAEIYRRGIADGAQNPRIDIRQFLVACIIRAGNMHLNSELLFREDVLRFFIDGMHVLEIGPDEIPAADKGLVRCPRNSKPRSNGSSIGITHCGTTKSSAT